MSSSIGPPLDLSALEGSYARSVLSEPERNDTSSSSGPTFMVEPSGPRPQQQVFFTILVRQNSSVLHSFDRFVAERFAAIPSVLGIHRERIDEVNRFYVLTTDESEEALDRVLDIEKHLYEVFPDDDLDIEILLGPELECAIPSGAVCVWQRN